MNIIKRLFYKHKHEYTTVTNLYGDVINHFGGVRSIRECEICGKRKFGGLDKNCNIANRHYEGE